MIGLCLFLSLASQLHAESAVLDDGWRRTKFGWENIRDWNLSPEQLALFGDVPVAATRPIILSPTTDLLLKLSHPLAIAFVLGTAAIVALRVHGDLEAEIKSSPVK